MLRPVQPCTSLLPPAPNSPTSTLSALSALSLGLGLSLSLTASLAFASSSPSPGPHLAPNPDPSPNHQPQVGLRVAQLPGLQPTLKRLRLLRYPPTALVSFVSALSLPALQSPAPRPPSSTLGPPALPPSPPPSSAFRPPPFTLSPPRSSLAPLPLSLPSFQVLHARFPRPPRPACSAGRRRRLASRRPTSAPRGDTARGGSPLANCAQGVSVG